MSLAYSSRTMMQALNPISLPLNQTVLIEASAGTGKTYTMVNLYLRLLLGVGCEPLSVEQILVVTFTKAATQELRDRIRDKVGKVAKWFEAYHHGEHEGEVYHDFNRDPFLLALLEQVKPELQQAMLRLRIAVREIDLASIFTIHSFCQKVLFQYAFDSGVRFDVDLQPDESELLKRLSEEVWRELFYPLDLAQTQLVSEALGSPALALESVKSYLTGELPSFPAEYASGELGEEICQYPAFIAEVKQFWQQQREAMATLLLAEINKKSGANPPKLVNGSSYQQRYFDGWWTELNAWAEGNSLHIPDCFSRFTTSFLYEKRNSKLDYGLTSPEFEQADRYYERYQSRFAGKNRPLWLYQFLMALRTKLTDYKATHPEKSFNDMIVLLEQALRGEQGETLANHIRQQYPFAMIDEFQDTDQTQYAIFSRIFAVENHGFIMIGDPKQSIYKFRGADIFTYLEAAKHADHQATLNRNWRSLPQVVERTNALFSFADQEAFPFIYQAIRFEEVGWKEGDSQLIGEDYFTVGLLEKYNKFEAAKWAARRIWQQLYRSASGEFGVKKGKDLIAFRCEDIAVLVRSKEQARIMKNALAECGVPAVILSEDRSVFASPEARDLHLLLRACLDPFHHRHLMASIGSSLWGLTASQLISLKQNETAWDSWVAKFVHYQQIWQQQGILPMLHQIFLEEQIIVRIRQFPNADRRITDLLHLAELLQEAMMVEENENALVRWFEQQCQKAEGKENQTLRLESEQKLVKIVTIHGSKGLEYPIVWLPFLGANSSKNRLASPPRIYHQEGERHWDLTGNDDEIKTLLQQAEFAEDLRLLYVAMTRAKYQTNLLLPKTVESDNGIFYLLTEGKFSQVKGQATLDFLEAKRLVQAKDLQPCPEINDWRPTLDSEAVCQPLYFERTLKNDGQIVSFSSLEEQHKRLSGQPEWESHFAQDYDVQAVEFTPLSETATETDRYSPFTFPQGTQVGTLLHSLFEHWDFRQPLAHESLTELCKRLDLSEEWHAPLSQWLEQIVTTPFGEPAFCLRDIAPQTRLDEWQFYLRLANPKALPKLNQLLKKYNAIAKHQPDLQLAQVEGFVRGFIDCIVQIDGRYYILDYKSNFLGHFKQDYAEARIAKAIGEFHYYLQYLLYTLAFHRYLRFRLGEQYDYQRDFGGVAYLFLRGMDGSPNSGVYFEKPNVTLIEEMDQLFG